MLACTWNERMGEKPNRQVKGPVLQSGAGWCSRAKAERRDAMETGNNPIWYCWVINAGGRRCPVSAGSIPEARITKAGDDGQQR